MTTTTPQGFCRDCFASVPPEATRCPACKRPRLKFHPELHTLTIAHMDCDAFYAAVEKRDNPELRDKPLIIGGGTRGVVSTCCYIARIRGVRSAMPMFKALAACPEAVVIKPDMTKYARVARDVRALMRDLTPLVEPVSIDEAFLDLSGTERLHHASAAISMARLAKRIEDEIGITVSVGLSHNKFLAKIASDLDKPRGFAIIGREETLSFLAEKPVSMIWGVGKALETKLARDGITRIAHLQRMEENDLMARYGSMGRRLSRLSRGLDTRGVEPVHEAKSISSETTFMRDIADAAELDRKLWPLCEKVSARAKAAGLSGSTIVLKLKTADFKTRTRNQTLPDPTQLAEVIYRIAAPMLAREATGTSFRLLGVGISGLADGDLADPNDLLDPAATRRAAAERAMDKLRAKFGDKSIVKGRGLRR
ncbi:DNA-directed DNA polymerase [Parvibaculum lavamentivorans DS-1]|uniref:DNA polymerase IV n=1 Tax=Parvibaculum lavamentivorans (strain DS-1 / DSM 13023 / NCIMB 13966) TaxID=402881 RepID=A7HWY4_PARL1|nr:DNA polymerase IV [Parvibaculum lavamentivorans]ABS64417.1 DNA-directed DNA polymerase [Parvibaculum lavamentivorans DS-1]